MAKKSNIRPAGILALIAGILVLVFPHLLSLAVGIYLVLIGILDIMGK